MTLPFGSLSPLVAPPPWEYIYPSFFPHFHSSLPLHTHLPLLSLLILLLSQYILLSNIVQLVRQIIILAWGNWFKRCRCRGEVRRRGAEARCRGAEVQRCPGAEVEVEVPQLTVEALGRGCAGLHLHHLGHRLPGLWRGVSGVRCQVSEL